jgi:PAS domain S-box-containing protein
MRRTILQYGFAILTTAIALILTQLLIAWLHPTIAVLFLAAVAISTWYGGMKPGMVTIVLSVLAIDYFFTPPINQFTVNYFGDVLRLIIFGLVASLINLLNSNLQYSKRKIERLSQQLAQENAQQLRIVLKAARMGIWDWNIVTGEITWNQEHELLFGFAPGTFDGRYETFNACLHPDDKLALEEAVKQAIAELTIYQHEYRIIWSDGSIHWIEGRGQMFYDEAGKAVRMAGTVMDIDQRKQAEKDIREREVMLSAIADNLHNGNIFQMVRELDGSDRFTYISSGVRLYGLEPEDLLKNPRLIIEQHSERDRLRIIQAVEEMISNLTQLRIQVPRYLPSGEVRWSLLQATPRRLEDGRTVWDGVDMDITDLKQTEAQLQEQEERWQLAIVGNNDGIWDHNLQTNKHYLSPRCREILGYENTEVSGFEDWFSLVYPEDQELLRQTFQAHLNRETPRYNCEYRMLSKNGTYKWLLSRGQALWDSKGVPVRAVGSITDISERKQAEMALQESEKRLTSLASAAPVGIFRTDLYGNIIYVNHRWGQISGSTLNEAQGTGWLWRLHPEDRDRVVREWYDSIEQNATFRCEYRFVCSDETVTWVFGQAVAERTVSGKTIGYIGTITDISDRKQAEIALCSMNAELEQRVLERTAKLNLTNQKLALEIQVRQQTELALQQRIEEVSDLYNNAPCGYQSLDSTGTFVLINDTELKWLGYTRDEILDKKKMSDLVTVQSRAVVAENYPKLKEKGCVNNVEIEMVRKDGTTFPVSIDGIAVCDTEGNFLMSRCVVSDISERRAIEKLKDEFISIVSHELRTPLTSIIGSLGLLKTGIYDNKPEKAKRMLEIALTDCERLVRLVGDILDLERLQSGKVTLVKEMCEVTKLMERAIESVGAIASQAHITIAIAPIPERVYAAPDAIIQTLTNLLSNAVKFSFPNTTVELAAKRRSHDILFQVKDCGRGIPADKLETVFGRFQQVEVSDSRQKGGTGLGLAICKNIVEQHGGEIWVESQVGRGSTFYFTLPV